MVKRKAPLDATELNEQPVAFLIPGIGIAYSKAVEALLGSSIFQDYCAIAGLDDLSKGERNALSDYEPSMHDNLKNQKLAYVVNCSMCDIYRKRGLVPKLIIGYSMGVYTALYSAGHYSFETGLQIVETAFHLTSELCSSRPEKYGVGLILGLTESELRQLLLKEVGDEVRIAVYNGKRSFVLAGIKERVDFCLQAGVELGALSVRKIRTEHPYHTSFLEGISKDFTDFLRGLTFSTPYGSVISLIDGRIISNDSLVDTIVRSICTSLRLDLVVEALVDDHHVVTCFETGPEQSMRRLVRYLSKKVKVHPFRAEENQ